MITVTAQLTNCTPNTERLRALTPELLSHFAVMFEGSPDSSDAGNSMQKMNSHESATQLGSAQRPSAGHRG